ncbi:MAG: alkaline phosphatase [Victivallales bacterium]|nr:alkaline phosphatase [Victivallales bacterium]
MKKRLFFLLLGLVLLTQAASPKYIFLFIGDGMSTPQRMIADEFAQKAGHGHLTMNTLHYSATTRTCSASSLVTDSAAAATAIACGEKTVNGRIGMSADGERKLESCAEVAHQKGKKVGIITSITINHATPAGFYAHRKSRGELYRISLDLVASNFEYFGGGGFANKHDDTKDSEYKGNIFDLAAAAGYTICKDKESFFALPPKVDKLIAVAGNGGLPFAIDGQESAPTLADYTRKGIEVLDNPNGFFFMIEGGEIDHCGHANDAASNLCEVLALDDAVRVAMEFYEKHKDETLVIITGDHETGGMTMGFAGTGYNLYMERLANQKCSIRRFNEIINDAKKAKPDFSFEDAKPLLTKYFNFAFEGDVKENPMVVTEKELASLEEGFKAGKLANAARLLISAKSGVGWTSGAHTALPVLTTSQGVGAELFTGFIENTDISKKIKSLL